MNVCVPLLPAGINASCLQDLKEIKNIVITTASASFTTPLNAASLSAWKTKIQTDLSVYAPLQVNDYENTTDDPAITTMQSTRKTVTNRPIPSGIFYLGSNFCDYKELLASLQGGNYRLFFIDNNGNIFGTKTDAGVVRGFSVQLTAVTKGLPLKEAAQNFKVFANFQVYEEFEKAVIVSPTWTPGIELTEAMPVGLNMYATSAITAGSITVRITERCGAAKTGLVVGDFEVVDSSELVTPGVATVTEISNGDYTLTLKKSTSTPLAAGDMIAIRVKKTVTIITHLSNVLTINALA
jgi:hypothetical protein